MVSKIQPTTSQTYCEQVSTWKNKEAGTIWKIAKFVIAMFAYIPAFLVDIAVGASQLVFGKNEEPVELKGWQKWKQKFFDVKDRSFEFVSNHRKQIIVGTVGTAAAIGTIYLGKYFGVYAKSKDLWSSYAPTLLGGNAKPADGAKPTNDVESPQTPIVDGEKKSLSNCTFTWKHPVDTWNC